MGREDPNEFTEKLQEELLTRASNTLASLARVALEILGVQDLAVYATARRLNPTLVYGVPHCVVSQEVVTLSILNGNHLAML